MVKWSSFWRMERKTVGWGWEEPVLVVSHLASLSIMVQWSSPWRTERKPIGWGWEEPVLVETQPLHNGEMVLALEDGEGDYWMRLRRACAGGEPASASFSTMEKWSLPWRTERKPIGWGWEEPVLVGSQPRPASPQWRSDPRPGGRRGRWWPLQPPRLPHSPAPAILPQFLVLIFESEDQLGVIFLSRVIIRRAQMSG